jgi:hypothetical protein
MGAGEAIEERCAPVIEASNIESVYGFKYAQAHVFSATRSNGGEWLAKQIAGKSRTLWTLRNDDAFSLRWGAAEFVREFVKNIPYEVSKGFYDGSDQYHWVREFLQRGVEETRELEVVKHCYRWMLWGRMGYDPELASNRLREVVAKRFGLWSSDAQRLMDAWQAASMVYPTTTGFDWVVGLPVVHRRLPRRDVASEERHGLEQHRRLHRAAATQDGGVSVDPGLGGDGADGRVDGPEDAA